MNLILTRIFFSIIVLSTSVILVNAQSQVKIAQKEQNVIVVGAKKTLSVIGKTGYLIVKTTGKAAWETTKFATKKVAAPLAKTIFIKAVPKITLTILKSGGKTIKKTAPIATKAAVTYLKL